MLNQLLCRRSIHRIRIKNIITQVDLHILISIPNKLSKGSNFKFKIGSTIIHMQDSFRCYSIIFIEP